MTLASAVDATVSEAPRVGTVRRTSWRAWMVTRALGRGLALLAKSVYLVSAVAAIGALGFGLLTIAVGGLLADGLSAFGLVDGLSHEVAASLATALVLGGVLTVVAARSIRPGTSPASVLRGARAAVGDRARLFASEWRTAGAQRALVLERRRMLRERERAARTAAPARLRSEVPITAHRVWLVAPAADRGGAALVAPVSGRMWPGREMVASCDAYLVRRLAGTDGASHEGPAPDLDCLCGIYGLKRSMWPPPRHRSPLASGTIGLSGTVIEGSRGYRAERAVIESPLQVSMACAGVLDGPLWTPRHSDFWEPTPPNPCPFVPETLAMGDDEYIGFCRMHARDAAERLSGVDMTSPAAVSAQLELRYGVDVTISGRGAQWT